MEPRIGASMKATSEGGHHDLMIGFTDVVTSVTNFWTEWGLRITVLGSLAAYSVLGLLSSTRRRSAPGRWSVLRWAAALIVWAAYQAVERAATSALGSLSLSGSDDASAVEHQPLVEFWAPFLLLHLGGPDNMAAYALEDSKLSMRKVFEMVMQLLGVIYAIWNDIYRGHSRRFLFLAAVIMFAVGATRSVVGEAADLDDREALHLAQDLFPIWRRALFDSSVDPRSASQEIFFKPGWRSMCKVAEMELSLMYDVLYTKAAVAHTWPGYLLRFVSPFATAAAASLFWLYRDDNNEEGRSRTNKGPSSFVVITYLLLGSAFAMDVVWLLRALGSTWTYYFLKTKMAWPWLRHKCLCSGRWRRIHRAAVYLDPLRLVFGIDPVSYRKWSGTIGRYNLLHECTAARRHPWRRWLATKLGLEETRYLTKLPEDVKKLLFERVRRILPWMAGDDQQAPRVDAYTMVEITTCWGQEALRRREGLFGRNKEEMPICAREFEQDVLAWHIATCIFLSRAKVRKLLADETPATTGHVAAIEAVSEYLMFLVAKRREMLPGLVLRKLFHETRRALEEIWDDSKKTTTTTSSSCIAGGGDKEKLATMLRRKRNGDRHAMSSDAARRLVLDAAEIAAALTKSSMRQEQLVKMLELVFNVWVDKLIHAGARCSRDSHAKQLSHGGELTTVLWIVVQHAGPFRIGELKPEADQKNKPPTTPDEENKPAAAGGRVVPDTTVSSGPAWYPCPHPCYPCPWHPTEPWVPVPSPEPQEDPAVKAKDHEMFISPQDAEDPEDTQDYNKLIKYATLY